MKDETKPILSGINLGYYKFPKGGGTSHVRNVKDAVRYCTLYCTQRKLGCRVGCRLLGHFEKELKG